MKSIYKAQLMLVFLPLLLYGQTGSINNTLGSGGTFTIINSSATTLFSLSESSGFLTLTSPLILNNGLSMQAGTLAGVISKGGTRFIHDYKASSTDGYNTFVGVGSGNFTMSYSSTSSDASYNTAVGNSSLDHLTHGNYNCAFGAYVLESNSTGYENSAFGYNALSNNSTGYGNSAFGGNSLGQSDVGTYNSAFGINTLQNCNGSAGSDNSAFGYDALASVSTGGTNSGFGERAGVNIATGSNNTCIGYNATASSNSVSNEITLGNGSVSTLRCQVTSITSLSDARDKRNIRDLTLGLDFLMKVKPRLFNWDRRDWYKDSKPDGSKMQKAPTAGFVAQELDEVQTKENADYLNLVLKSNPHRLEATSGNLLPIMVKAIQDLKGENDALKKELMALRASIAEVKKEVASSLKVFQQEDATAKVSMNQTKH